MPLATLADGTIHYERYGAGFPIVFISGLGGQGSAWQRQIEPFSQTFTVLLHDHRGTGGSSRSLIDYSIAKLASDVIGLMDALKIERAHVVGHSTGGTIAQSLALDHPGRVAKLALVSTFAKSDPVLRLALELRRDILRAMGPEAYLRTTPFFIYPSWWLAENPAVLEGYAARGAASFPGVEIMSRKIEAVLAFDRAAELGRIRHSTLVIAADNDALVAPRHGEELKRSIPNARLALLTRGGHTCKQTIADEFNRLLLAFLREGE